MLCLFLSTLALGLFINPTPTHAYTATLTTSENVSLDTVPNNTTVHSESINVTSTCKDGYNLTISTSGDNKLYKDGSTSNTDGIFNPVNPSYALNDVTNNSNTWGYSLTNAPGTVGAFNPISTTPAFLRTASQTAVETGTINDTFSIYYGTNTHHSTPPGSYYMASNGKIVYYLTLAESCTESVIVNFHPNAGSDPVSDLPSSEDVIIGNNTITLPNTIPTRTGYTFKEWNTAADGTGKYYAPGATIVTSEVSVSGFVDLYAIWQVDCSNATICYDGNHADAGTMNDQSTTSGGEVTLIASNFSRSNYGFAGWNTKADGTGTNYGPNQTITMPDSGGLNLYAKWIKVSGSLQGYKATNSLNVGDVIALRDIRDNEVYAVTKLADNNIWIIENLRTDPGLANITDENTNHPTSTFVTEADTTDDPGGPKSLSSNTLCGTDGTDCDDQIQYNANSLNRNLTQAYDTNGNNVAWYSYGIYYNWYTATAGNGTYSKSSGNVSGDLCPASWKVPTGNTSGQYNALNTAINNGATGSDANWRIYPNNFVWSGDYNKTSRASANTYGRLWTATAASNNNAYRTGYRSNEVSIVNKSYNKWDGFNMRCIYQGDSTAFSDVTVSFPESGISSVTFTNNNYATETATKEYPIVTLANNTSYTVTATTETGYELTNWSTTSGGTLGSATVNPTTYEITDATTLTVSANVLPSYSVTVTLPEHVTSITFTSSQGTETVTTSGSTISLKKNAPYTVTATFEEGYTLNNWIAGTSSTLSSTTTNPTIYTVTGDSTITLTTKEAELLTYTLNYDAGTGGTSAPSSQTETSYQSSYEFTIDNSTIPFLFGYHFIGYSETPNSSTAEYAYSSSDSTFTPSTITVTNLDPTMSTTTTKTLYAVYVEDTCLANRICYFDNGADETDGGKGTMSNQTASSNTSATLIPSNYSKSGYGFAGWQADANGTTYGPNQTITTGNISSSGMKLYAKWVQSEGNLQGWRGCNALSQGSVTALTDTRDNQTYAVAKLADDNCWIIENFRLDPATTTITAMNTHNPTATFITQSQAGSGSSLASDTLCNSNNSTCFDQLQYNTNSLKRNLTQSYTNNDAASGWYSYGVYYNWYTATAGNGTYSSTSSSGPDGNGNVAGDICPLGWHLPTGNSTGEYNALNTAINNGSTSSDTGWRTYPNNFIWSGDYNNNKRTSSYGNGRLWTSTASENTKAYRIGYASDTVTASSNTYNKWDGFIVRCVKDDIDAEFADLTVTFPTGVSSITFESTKYGAETATPQNPTVQLAENAAYTITANMIGYELDEWVNGANSTIGSITDNPTTLTITDDSTLTLTVQEIPAYTVTVNMDQHVSSISFYHPDYGTQLVTTNGSTASLRRGIEYTISATLVDGYKVEAWGTTLGGTLGSTTDQITTYTVANTTTLSLTTNEKIIATLDIGKVVNAKMNYVSSGSSSSSYIDSIKSSTSLPTDFTPTTDNTISIAGSQPIYIYPVNSENNYCDIYVYSDVDEIYMNEDSSYMFSRYGNLEDLEGVSNWNASNVKNMSHMFFNDSIHNTDGVSNWDTSNVTDMSWMFFYAVSDDNMKGFSGWNTENVVNMSHMFEEYIGTDIDFLSDWDTSNVTDMSYMFYGAFLLTNIDGAINWDTRNVTNMQYMFSDAADLTNIDGAINWDTGNVTDMSNMFSSTNIYNALANIDGAINWDTGNVTDMSYMFYQSFHLNSINGAKNWNTSSVTDMSYMFYNTDITNINSTKNWNTSSVTDMNSMFSSTSSLTNIDGVANWNTGNVTNMRSMFEGASITNIDSVRSWNTRNVTDMSHMFDSTDITNIDGAINWNTSNVMDMSGMFSRATALANIDGAVNWNTSSVTTMGGASIGSDGMFYNASSLINIDGARNWNTGSVTNMRGMFSNADSLADIDGATNWDTSNVTGMNGMFYGASSLANINGASKWNTSSVTDMSLMFAFDTHLTNIDGASNWNTGNVTNMNRMFDGLDNQIIKKVPITDLSALNGWDTSNVTNMSDMFRYADNLTDVSGIANWDTSKVTNMIQMFAYDNNIIETSYLNDWDVSNVVAMVGASSVANKFYQMFFSSPTYPSFTKRSGVWNSDGTFMPSSFTCITDCAVVTVSIDSHIDSVDFYNSDYGTETITSDGGTISLRKNIPYTITAHYDTGYMVDNWYTGPNGTLSDTEPIINTIYTVTGDSTLTLNSKPGEAKGATLITGKELNAKMKTLAEGKNSTYNTNSNKIKSLQTSSALPTGFTPTTDNTVSTSDSPYPVYIYFDNTNDAGIMYFYSEANYVFMNPDSSYSFYCNKSLNDISTLANWDSRDVTSMDEMFSYTSIVNIDVAIDWDTSSVTSMEHAFWNASSLTNIDGAINWDTSNVANMRAMFYSASSLTNIDGAINWDTSNVTAMNYQNSIYGIHGMFSGATSLTNIDGAINWDISNITIMDSMFSGTSIVNISALANWDTSSVTSMAHAFSDTPSLTNIDGASNWNVSNVTYMRSMFYNASSLTNIDGASNWNVSNVTNMGTMFYNTYALTNGFVINSWDIGKAIDDANNSIDYMFTNSPTHPYFTNYPGKWYNGTFYYSTSQTVPNYIIDVTLDEHVSSAALYSPEYGVQVVTNTNNNGDGTHTGTVTLYGGTDYTITGTYTSGYEFSNWATRVNGTLADPTAPTTTYTVTGASTLTLTSQPSGP